MSAVLSLPTTPAPTGYQQRLARALGLLAHAEALRAERQTQSRAAEARLAEAVQAAVEALDALDAAGDTVLDAVRHVVACREGTR